MSTNQPLAESSALPVIEAILTAVPPAALGGPALTVQNQAVRWKAIEQCIAAWTPADGEADERIDEDGYAVPGRKAIAVAMAVAARLREAGVDVPLRSGQTANGGVNFEWRSGSRTKRLTVNALGETELASFEDSTLISRTRVTFSKA